jgi:hypothetical protein
LQSADVYIKQYPSYNNDNSEDVGSYTSGRDEMSKGNIFTPGSPDNFSSNPIGRGTHSIYTNVNDYWYSLASMGDRWDAWNVGYNEVFSPYSSPNTKAMDNSNTGIFVWYRQLDTSNNKKATIKIYRAGNGGLSEDSILHLTPPSRPMGLRVLSCDSIPAIGGYKRIKLRWFHNMEPDMRRLNVGEIDTSKRYKIYRSTGVDMNSVPPDAMQHPENYYNVISTVNIGINSIPEFIDSVSVSSCNISLCGLLNCWVLYPVRYRVQAIDKYDSASVLSDFAKTKAWNTSDGDGSEGPDNPNIIQDPNLPKEFSLKQNYPNPFNPSTNIQYDLPSDNFVNIKIYDILGKEVMSLVNEFKNAGSYIISFNASNLSSGIYYYKIEAGKFEQIRKMILVK